MRKPKRVHRDVYYPDTQWQQIRKAATPPSEQLLDFLYWTGCRPHEARRLEAHDIVGDIAILPLDPSKGQSQNRKIELVPQIKPIIE